MPRLSDSMEEGTIVTWLRTVGDEVADGEELVEIESDKATMVYEAPASGVLAILVEAGETVEVGAPIATLGDNGAAPAASGDPAEEAAAEEPEPVAEQPEPTAEAPAAASEPGRRVVASPIARRLAAEHGIDLTSVAASGPGGRVSKADVEAALAGSGEQPTEAPAAPAEGAPERPESAKGEQRFEDLSRVQQVIARRMSESRATVPEFALTAEVEMTAATELRASLKQLAAEGEPVPSFNDMVVRACALALRAHPRGNGSYRDGRFELHDRINVGVAVAADDALVVPTVFDADRKTLGEIAVATRELAARVRAGTISPPELAGGTFTVSNLGMFGVDSFEAIINAPQAAILAVGAIAERPVVREGEIVARPTMRMTLACDHRILYGADAAQLLAAIRELLEQPLRMAL